MASATASYWCYRCSRFVRVWPEDDTISCPHCNGGFVEEIDSAPPTESPNHRLSPPDVYVIGNNYPAGNPAPRRRRRNAGDRSPYNPVIVLRGPDGDGGGSESGTNSFELYYDDGTGSGLQPLPRTMSEFLMGSGFDRLLDQLSQIEVNGLGLGRADNPPASKAAVESMPTIEIVVDHVRCDAHCAVCMEAFDLGSEAREMPCKHIFHAVCILPWLALRNSCPVCRHELPTDLASPEPGLSPSSAAAEAGTVGLTIWRLPGGGFAVGRFAGRRRAGDQRDLPVVYTEVDGDLNGGGAPRMISWASSRSRSRGGSNSGLGRVLRHVFSFIGRFRRPLRTSNVSSEESGSLFGSRHLSRRQA